MTRLAPLMTSFLREYMPHQRGYSPHSCETYALSFKLLLEFAARRTKTKPSQLSVEQLDAALIQDFLMHIERERGNGAATRNLRLAAIKTFMRYVEYQVPSALEQIGRIHALPAKRHDQKLIRHLTMEEVRAILNVPDFATRSGVRDRAMMHLCFAAALRVSELVGIPVANVALQRTPSVVVHGKPQGALPAAMEGDRSRPAGMACSERARPRPGAVRQRRGCADDTRGLRICARYVNRHGIRVLPHFRCKPGGVGACSSSGLRDHAA